MNNRKLRIAAMIIIVFVIVLLPFTVFSNRPLSYNISQAYSLSPNFATVEAYDNNSLIYSSGQALMLYNYVSGVNSQLSPVVNLYNTYGNGNSAIDSLSVSENEKFILFHDEQVAPDGILYHQLINQGLNPQNDYWWLYSVANQSFQPLPQSTILAKINGDNVEALSSAGGSGEALISYSTMNLEPKTTVNVSGINDFFVTDNGFVLQTPGNNILFTKDGVVSQQLAQEATVVAVTANSQQAVIVTGQNNSRQLALLDLQKHTQKAISPNITGQPVWLNSGTVLYAISSSTGSSTSTTLYSYDLATKRTFIWNLVNPIHTLGNSSITPIALVGTKTAVISNSSSSYYLIGSGLAKSQKAI